MKSKEDLLKELSTMIHIDSNRKRRSDAGQKHKTTKDEPINQTKMAIYNRVKARIINKDNSLLRGFDENGFYLLIPAAYNTVASNYKQEYKGRQLQHTVSRKCVQKEIDLEEYRFNAWKELAIQSFTKDNIVEPNSDLRGILFVRYNLPLNKINDIIVKRQITNAELFSEIYFVEVQDIPYWDYDTWRKHYECCPKMLLPEDFKFRLDALPGTPEFMPEWQYHKDKIDQQQKIDAEQERERKSNQFISNLRRRK